VAAVAGVFGIPSSSKEAVSCTPNGHFPTHEL
jgi:hypothetical protein